MQLEASGVKILTDPWLQGKLHFAGQTWFFEGEKPYLEANSLDVREFTKGVDFILLSQSLDDHCHKPTLQALPKDIPVVATPTAADIARELGFKTVHSLDHGQTVRAPTLSRLACMAMAQCAHVHSRAAAASRLLRSERALGTSHPLQPRQGRSCPCCV